MPELNNREAVDQLIHLYHAWLGYLLVRLDEEEIRVPASEIKGALGKVFCTTTKEGDDYIIRVQRKRKGDIDDRNSHELAR